MREPRRRRRMGPSRAVRGLLLAVALTAAGCGGGDGGNDGATADFKFGMILVGAQNDHGWSQAHYEAGRYVVEQLRLPSEALIVADKVNPADRPDTSIE